MNIWFQEKSEMICLGATLVTLIIIFLAVLSGYFWGFSKGKVIALNSSQNNSADTNTNSFLPETPSLPAPLTVFSYSGKVISLEGKTVSLSTSVQENNQMVDKTIKVTISDNTSCSKLDITKLPPPPNTNEKQDDREKTIPCGEIQPEDSVVVYAGENVKDKSEFEATKIKILVAGFEN
ncbi:MAG: hypothetical protein COT24_05685 [Candidatus Kerfeldbacteria bacterium CG08_land_8_20_14_0_20_40_16]|uniref:DUF5666 domain-containing protein n=1 Tax=Candidatus Kerfeldbacteria bacterium CG08_land_8_20_14_0_20_40_16 TaxID=2014244 RepID=A0A2H0YUP2_9BACT|nr:MAG: hypothetical protein COT24_05685 [Candidatus Kerfeldbacteria bacterium CG08_land_8_20_14_0_20_40_16]